MPVKNLNRLANTSTQIHRHPIPFHPPKNSYQMNTQDRAPLYSLDIAHSVIDPSARLYVMSQGYHVGALRRVPSPRRRGGRRTS